MLLLYYCIVGICYGITQLITGDENGKEAAREQGGQYHENLRYKLGELTGYVALWPLFVIHDIKKLL